MMDPGSELVMLAKLVSSAALILIIAAVFILIMMRPQWGTYLYLTICPLIAGIGRGDIIPLRPNEFLLIFISGALAVRWYFTTLARENREARLNRVDLAMVLLVLTMSVIPLFLRNFRDLHISKDDVLYSMVMWKCLVLYCVVRSSISTSSQVLRCLWLSMTSAALVGMIAVLQVGELLGIPEFLHTYYDSPFEGVEEVVTSRATSTLATSFGVGDTMIMNLMIALALLQSEKRGRGILLVASALFLSGCIAAGSFSGVIGLGVAIAVFAAITGRLSRVLTIGLPALILTAAAFWPVVSKRLAGFERPSGLPQSWEGRWNNLEDYVFPELFSGVNWLVGVRPAARLPAHEAWREFVYIESGYVWLLWIGGIPLLAAFFFFVWASGQHLLQIIRGQRDAVWVAATAGFTFLVVLVTLMLVDPHFTLRGTGDLFFALLALSFVRDLPEEDANFELRFHVTHKSAT